MKETTISMWAHISNIVGAMTHPFNGIIMAFLIWKINNKKSDFINKQGKEALNFSITVFIGFIVIFASTAMITAMVAPDLIRAGKDASESLGPLAAIVNLVFRLLVVILAILAASQTKKAIEYRYPVCIRFIK